MNILKITISYSNRESLILDNGSIRNALRRSIEKIFKGYKTKIIFLKHEKELISIAISTEEDEQVVREISILFRKIGYSKEKFTIHFAPQSTSSQNV